MIRLAFGCLGRFPGLSKLWLARCPGPQHDNPETRGGPCNFSLFVFSWVLFALGSVA